MHNIMTVLLTSANQAAELDLGDKINLGLLIVAVLSALFALLAYKHQRNRSKKQEACNLAKHYADSIISRYSLVTNVFSECKKDVLVKNIVPMSQIASFDKREASLFAERADRSFEEILAELCDIPPEVVLVNKMMLAKSANERIDFAATHLHNSDDDDGVEITNIPYLLKDFDWEVTTLLNELEWFSMSCRYGLADEKLIYQSLHQTFFSIVWQLYFHISWRNVSNADKYYCNIIWLFNKWNRRINRTKGKADRKRAWAARKIVKAEERLINVSEREFVGKGV